MDINTQEEALTLFAKWRTAFESQKQKPMEADIGELLLACVTGEKESIPMPDEFKTEYLFSLVTKRANMIGLKISDPLCLFLSFLCSTPADAVMYLYALRARTEEASIHSLCEMFPDGFPSEESMQAVWDLQKISKGNLLDYIGMSIITS